MSKKTNVFAILTILLGMALFMPTIVFAIDNFPGTALEFDGLDDYVSGSGIATPFTNITLEAWVRHNSLPAGQVQRYVTIGQEVAVLRHDGTSGTDQLHFYIRQSNGALYSIRINDVLTTNEWFHVTGTYDGVTMKLYLNGSEIGSATPDVGGLYPCDGTFLFSYLSGESLNGKLDEIRLWNVARTTQQIRENMHLTLDGTETGLVSYWQLNEGTGTTVNDPISGNNGTMQNMTEDDWVNSTAPVGGGTSNTQIVSTTGSVTFTGTDLLMDFTEKTGTDTIVVSRLNIPPSNNPTDPDDVFDEQYWIINSFGNGTYKADIKFYPQEGFTQHDQSNPGRIRLYNRDATSSSNWDYVTYASDLGGGVYAKFDGITEYGQFIIGRKNVIPTISLVKLPVEFTLIDNNYLHSGGDHGTPTFTDLDNDGRLDLISGGLEGDLIWFEQNSPGSPEFTLISNNFNGIDIGYCADPTFTDIDFDGLLDLIIGEQYGHLYHYEQDEVNSTTFTFITDNFEGIDVGICGHSSPCFNSLCVGSDLILGEGTGTIEWWHEASPSWQLITNNFNNIDVGIYSTPDIIDFDYDGNLDLLIGEYYGTIKYYKQGSICDTFDLVSYNYCGIDVGMYSSPSFSDVDGNGLIDMIIGHGWTSFYWYEQTKIQTVEFDTIYTGAPSAAVKYLLNGVNLTGDVNIQAPEGFKISLAEWHGWQQNLTIPPGSQYLPDNIFIRFEPAYAGSFSGEIVHTSQGAEIKNIAVSGTYLVPDKFAGNALNFDGIDDYVEIADDNSLDFITNYTIETWIKPESFSWIAGIVTKYHTAGSNGYLLRLHSDSPYTGLCFDEMYTSTGILEQDKWYHIAAVNDNGTRKLYLNGELQVLTGTPISVQSNSDPVCFGVDFLASGRFFNGDMDEVRIWNIARTQVEIRENMHLTLSGQETGLISYWQFNEGSGTLASDALNRNNGTLYNMNDDDWIISPIPLGDGKSNSQTEIPGLVDFTDTGLSMFFNAHNGAEITVSKIEMTPNINPTDVDTLFNSQYWVVNRYGDGAFDANLTFTVNEDLTTYHQNNPVNITLYDRGSFETGDWNRIFIADVIDAATNQATFNNISGFSQFILGIYHDSEPPYIADSYPADDGSVFISDDLTITFSEKVFDVAGKSLTIYNIEGTIFQYFALPHPYITGSGTNTITINHNNLIMQNDYCVNIQPGTFIDLSGNEFAGLSGPTDWNFSAKVGGVVSSNTVLTDPVDVESDIYIQDGKTLTIEAGSTVEFQDYYKIDVDGRLLAVGTKNDRIIFTVADTTGFYNHTHTGWNGIEFIGTPATNDSSKIEYCLFEYGKTNLDDDAGALYIWNFEKVKLGHCAFKNNIGYFGGAVKCFYNAGILIQNCLFDNNYSISSAGGLFIGYSNIDLINNLFINNSSDYFGGAIHIRDEASYFNEYNIINNTICDNSSNKGGGIYHLHTPDCFYYNNIIYGNTANYGSQIYKSGYNLEFYYCDIEGGQAGIYPSFSGVYENCIETNPQFDGTGDHPYNLTAISPCINAGTPDTTGLNLPATDFAGNPRIYDGIVDRIDIGAYEFQGEPGPLGIPQNVDIEVIGTDVHISWDEVTGANSYKIYASDDPYSADWGTAVDTVFAPNTTWTSSITEEKKFYYVVASTETARRKLNIKKKVTGKLIRRK